MNPSTSSVLGDFNPCTFPGYSDADGSGVPAATIDLLGRCVVQGPAAVFTRGAGPGSEIVYGWVIFVFDGTAYRLLAVQRNSAPLTISAPGQTVVLTPLYLLVRG